MFKSGAKFCGRRLMKQKIKERPDTSLLRSGRRSYHPLRGRNHRSGKHESAYLIHIGIRASLFKYKPSFFIDFSNRNYFPN